MPPAAGGRGLFLCVAPALALVREEQGRRGVVLDEMARDAAEQVFAHPAAAIGAHHQKVGAGGRDGLRQCRLGAAFALQFDEFGRDAVPGEVCLLYTSDAADE